MKKIRLLQKVTESFPEYGEKELFAMILCGEILVDGQKLRDPKLLVSSGSAVELVRKKYVSRGGLKLEKALALWKPPVRGKRILDAGCSTGGFTDCLIQHGAAGVYAVDVGYNQLDFSLRKNPAVTVMERTNIMHVSSLDPPADWAVADLSFRSIRSAASHILGLTSEKFLIALIKPQFEWKEPDEEFDGIVRNRETLLSIAEEVMDELEDENAFVRKAAISPVPGRKGNREFLFWITTDSASLPGKDKLLAELSSDLL